MTWGEDCQKHAARAAEARRRMATAAACTDLTTADAAAEILAGTRALLWLAAGMRRTQSTALINALFNEYPASTVLRACIAACAESPPGPAAWLRQVCKSQTTMKKGA